VHWVQPGVVQFGDPLSRDLTKHSEWGSGGSGPRMSNKPLGVAEFSKKAFLRGSVGLAYRVGSKPENADSQIFILTAPNPAMLGKYAQIGHVTKGLAVADKIEAQDVIKNVTVR
jgi:cyclophilin family peptidyl-prolyl cis-trans isomerase